jgi:hypothetical protein
MIMIIIFDISHLQASPGAREFDPYLLYNNHPEVNKYHRADSAIFNLV